MEDLKRYIRLDQDPNAEIYVEPSSEAKLLVKKLGWLVAPKDGQETWLGRMIGVMMVAPFTQMTVMSFDLQAFLYEVFHQKIWSRVGHFVFMLGVNFFLMAGFAQVTFGAHPTDHTPILLGANLGTAYAALLLFWYGAMAYHTRMWAWWLVMIPVVGALCAGANLFYSQTFTLDVAAHSFIAPSPLLTNPWLWMMVSAFMIALSHAPEPKLPPRVTRTRQWASVPEFIFGPEGQRRSVATIAVRAFHVAMQSFYGTLDEWWASPRLMPYNFLMLMFKFGYRPEVYAEIRSHVDRAIASGNPALDYVGTGGGVFLNDAAV